MAEKSESSSPRSTTQPSHNSPGNGAGGDKARAKGRDPAAGRGKGKDSGAGGSRDSGIVLSPAMMQQMRSIIENHPVLKREADNNVPFTNHMLDLVAVPGEFQQASIENTTQASSYINAETSKIRAHLAVVQKVVEGTTDPDAKRRLEREAGALESHIKQVKSFMRLSFQSALSGNPASQGSFGAKEPAGLKRMPLSSESVAARSSVAATSPGTPASTPLSPYIVGTKQKPAAAARPSNPNTTHVPLSSALAHVATQSTRQSGPVDLDGGSRILSKRKIQELVGEIDPTERLEPEVEDILCDIADEFIESVTSFACQLAKHRKSDTLEAKDLQLHLERNWNIRIPGFASEEIRSVRKSTVSQAHQEKLNAITTTKNLRKFN
ncbi:Transcription initiation factor TFIID subunit 12 [Coemansia sp. RSA 552]|nr:Transcription initiation factor TFIID subunit 12 [Coemansia sp. RSA 552]